MFIKLVDIEVSDLGSATSFFADVLEVPVRPPGWNSRSIYFSGPDQMVLELIARRERARPSVRIPELISISEVGIAVSDPLATAQVVQAETGASVLGSSSPEFVPVGDHDGLLILVKDGRGWLPRFEVAAHILPLRISVARDTGDGERELNSRIRLNSLAEATAFSPPPTPVALYRDLSRPGCARLAMLPGTTTGATVDHRGCATFSD
jgi:hypothetical protein